VRILALFCIDDNVSLAARRLQRAPEGGYDASLPN
jgi:hypothetical protein